MANYANLKAAINAVIKQNGQGEITGEVMNQVLMAMVNSLGDGYLFMGVATPYTNPEVPDQNVFYLAVQAGTYSNFNSAVVPHGITILKYGANGWSSDNLLTFDTAPNKTSENPLTNKAITIHGSAFDISELNKVNDTPATYASLSAAIAAIPANIHRGGMSIKYIQSSDNKYVQYFLTNQSWSVDIADWQEIGSEEFSTGEKVSEIGIDDEPTEDSDNLVKSGGVAEVSGYYKNSNEYSEILIDQSNKILESRDSDGNKTFHCDVTFEGNVESNNLATKEYVEEQISAVGKEELYTDLIDAVTDEENKTIEGTDVYGRKIFYGGIITPDKVLFKPSVLHGKKWAVLGDSFTNGGVENGVIEEFGKYTGYRCVYPYIIGNRTGINVLKFFEGGRTLAYPADGTFHNSVTDPTADCYYQNIPEDIDYITIYLGINDEGHATGSGGDGEDYTGVIPLGTISDATTATYYGAWNVVLSWLRENRPFAHIGIIVTNGTQGTTDYMDAQIAIAKKYGLPYLNLNGDERCPAMIRTCNTDIPNAIKTILINKQAVDPDGQTTGTVNLHPNRDAHIFESTFIENFLNTL